MRVRPALLSALLSLAWIHPAAAQSTPSPDAVAEDADAPEGVAPEGTVTPAEVFASLDEGFGVRSADHAYQLRVGGLFAPRIGVREEGGEVSTVAKLQLARLNVTGHLADRLVNYQLQVEFAGDPRLLDLELDVRPWDEVRLRLGQFRTPFSREYMTGLPALSLPDRSLVSDHFRADRDIGAALDIRPFDGRLEVHAGAFDGGGGTRPFDDAHPLIVGRVVAAPLGAFSYDERELSFDAPFRFAIGAGAYAVERQSDDDDGPAMRQEAFGVDVALRWTRVHFSAEAFLDHRGEVGGPVKRGGGAFVQATVGLVEGSLDAAARFSQLSPAFDDDPLRGLRRYELGLDWYILGPSMRLQARYGYGEQDEAFSEPIHAPSLGHEGILQLQLQL